jgi:hypothetical protein
MEKLCNNTVFKHSHEALELVFHGIDRLRAFRLTDGEEEPRTVRAIFAIAHVPVARCMGISER